MLSDEHIDLVKRDIDNSTINIQELKDDLLDHFCCFIEYEMKKGATFPEAYKKAYSEITPGGFDEIQKETIFLLNAKRIIIMKRVIYSIGLLSSVCFSAGWLFKILHLPGGDDLLTYGFLSFVLIFLPLLAFNKFKGSLNKILSEKLKIILGFTSTIIAGVGVLLKVLHLPGGNLMLLVGSVVFILGFLPFLFFRMYKKSLE